jgi:hypothetical protein
VLNVTWTIMQWLLVIALVLFFAAPLMNDTSTAWRLRLASAAIILSVFAVAIVVVEIRHHPIVSVGVIATFAFASYGVLEFRKRLQRRKPEPFVEFLNLRSMGKRPVDLNDHPDAFPPEADDAADEHHEPA